MMDDDVMIDRWYHGIGGIGIGRGDDWEVMSHMVIGTVLLTHPFRCDQVPCWGEVDG